MLCKYPSYFRKVSTEAAFPCGQCLPCRVNKRRIWAHRIKLEALSHSSSVFLTLTYDDDNLPQEFVDPDTGELFTDCTLSPDHHREFMYRLRTRFRRANNGAQLRFYMVGEYGEKTQRPHYHYALFGYPQCRDRGSYWLGKKFVPCSCPPCKFISEVWGKGHIFIGELNVESANYIAQYVTKKMTSKDDPRLFGRFPEFSRSSRNPGIAGYIVDNIASQLKLYNKDGKDDLPTVLLHGKHQLPLGRYLSDKLHEKLEHSYQDGEKLLEFEKSMRRMFLFDPSTSQEALQAYKGSVASALELVNSQAILNMEKKRQLFEKDKLI